ncbi:MAG: flavin reductase family protein [Dehalobacterium sp.]
MEKNNLVWESSQKIFEQLPKGIFLTVNDGNRMNVMTIGWGNMGFIWRKPIFIALVRYSRYTYELLEKSGEFAVCVPQKDSLQKELAFCGTKSGRDFDKFAECNLTKLKGQVISAPIIKECGLHLECKVIYKQGMDQSLLNPKIKDDNYAQGDYHVMYYGEIVACYEQK